MFKSIKYVLVSIILLSVSFLSTNVRAQESITIGNVENAKIGSYVIFNGTTWRLIGDNYIILNNPLKIAAYDKGTNNEYASSDIRYYLNKDFLDNFGSAKKFIADVDWGTGDETLEDSQSINDKVSMPSYSDLKIIKEFMKVSSSSMWSRTCCNELNKKGSFWSLNMSNGYFEKREINEEAAIYPVLCIVPNIDIEGTGTEFDPYTIKSTAVAKGSIGVSGITLDDKIFEIKVGEQKAITPIFNYEDGQKKIVVNANRYLDDKTLSTTGEKTKYGVMVTNDKIRYISSNDDIAYVDEKGYVFGKKAGVATITVKGRGWNAKAVVTVK
ncbi:MAG: hypothetical protein F8N39_13360 [Clostridiaceae bacterium]|nr:hypothetical protein [Clostridiaceae bacterium]